MVHWEKFRGVEPTCGITHFLHQNTCVWLRFTHIYPLPLNLHTKILPIASQINLQTTRRIKAKLMVYWVKIRKIRPSSGTKHFLHQNTCKWLCCPHTGPLIFDGRTKISNSITHHLTYYRDRTIVATVVHLPKIKEIGPTSGTKHFLHQKHIRLTVFHLHWSIDI